MFPTSRIHCLVWSCTCGACRACCRYDKSAFGGLGDRADPAAWPVAAPPVDIVLLEGWMLGFRPVGAVAAAAVDAGLAPVDDFLGR